MPDESHKRHVRYERHLEEMRVNLERLRSFAGSPAHVAASVFIKTLLDDATYCLGDGNTDQRNRELAAQVGLLNRILEAFS